MYPMHAVLVSKMNSFPHIRLVTIRTFILLQLFHAGRVPERPGEEARLQRASRSLLQGISILLEQGEAYLIEGPGRVHSRGRAEAALRRQQVSVHPLGSFNASETSEIFPPSRSSCSSSDHRWRSQRICSNVSPKRS